MVKKTPIAKPRKKTIAQILLEMHLRELGLTGIEFEYDRAIPGRNYRFDLAIPKKKMLFECDGGIYSGGHRHAADWEKQYEKGNLAQLRGWKVFTFSNRQVLNGDAKSFLREHASRDGNALEIH